MVIESANGVDIFDGMVLLQPLAKVQLSTFGTIAEYIINKIMRESSVVYFVTASILKTRKSFLRQKRMFSGNLRF